MFELFQDSIKITRFYYHLNIFGTMTTNPNWPKILQNLLHGQSPTNWSNLVSCAFKEQEGAF
jgi:hypothetical protein